MDENAPHVHRESPAEDDHDELARLRADIRRSILDARATTPAPKSGSAPAGGAPQELTAEGLDAFVQANDKVVVDVWAPWCGPCRYLSPIVSELAAEMVGTVAFAKVNSDEEPAVPMKYGIQGIPTLLLFRGGKLVGRLVGAMPKEALRARLKGPLGL